MNIKNLQILFYNHHSETFLQELLHKQIKIIELLLHYKKIKIIELLLHYKQIKKIIHN
jgi:hypothetical protein